MVSYLLVGRAASCFEVLPCRFLQRVAQLPQEGLEDLPHRLVVDGRFTCRIVSVIVIVIKYYC